MKVNELMEKLIIFINSDVGPKYDLLKISIFHHHFAWIHPFDN
jgi:Fic family protein